MSRTDLTLQELERFDRGSGRGTEKRFCCPLPACADKPRDPAHRSLAVNIQTGAWMCHRCGASGVLQEFRTPLPKAVRQRAKVKNAFQVQSQPQTRESDTASHATLSSQLQKIQPLTESAIAYLRSRGIPEELAEACGVRYSSDWFGRPAVVFPIRNEKQKLVAAQGRYLDGRTDPKTRTAGPAGEGVFFAPAHAGESILPSGETPIILIVEAPIDALSLAACGFTAWALIGTRDGKAPAWLLKACAFHRVLLALDADEAGDNASHKLATSLQTFGTRVERLRPTDAKDWNEVIQKEGIPALRNALTRTLGAKPAPRQNDIPLGQEDPPDPYPLTDEDREFLAYIEEILPPIRYAKPYPGR